MSAWTNNAGTSVHAAVILALLGGCGGVSEVTRQQVMNSASSIQQAQQAIGNSESGALDLQRAKENLSQAQQALNEGESKLAERFARLARLNAELAVAKAQSASARRAAEELRAGIETLRKEAERASSRPELPQ